MIATSFWGPVVFDCCCCCCCRHISPKSLFWVNIGCVPSKSKSAGNVFATAKAIFGYWIRMPVYYSVHILLWLPSRWFSLGVLRRNTIFACWALFRGLAAVYCSVVHVLLLLLCCWISLGQFLFWLQQIDVAGYHIYHPQPSRPSHLVYVVLVLLSSVGQRTAVVRCPHSSHSSSGTWRE